MRVVLKYGTEGLPVELEPTPGFQGVIAPSEPPALAEPGQAVARSLEEPIASPPLAELARGRRSACVVISDITRPVPNPVILPPVLRVLEGAGIPRERITILIATGMHRASTPGERERLLGGELLGAYRVEDHDSRDRDALARVGTLEGGVPVLINRTYLEAECKVLTGFIEPHMWAGYSGGRKSLLPGLSGIETLQYMHGPEMVAHPGTVYGKLDGNPFHEAGLRVMEMAGADFIVNVTLDTRKRITGVFSGHPVEAHLRGCAFLSEHCVREVEAPLDFIVTTNAGAPLDCNLYQTVKGMTGGAAVVKPGGDIVIASACPEGVGSPEYRKILEMVDAPQAFLERLMRKEFFIPDQWCAQETYQVVCRNPVWVYTDGLSPRELERFHLHPVRDVAETVRHLLGRHGPDARWAVVPDGPMVILKPGGPAGTPGR